MNCLRPEPGSGTERTHTMAGLMPVSSKAARVGQTQKDAIRKGTKSGEPILLSQGLLQRFRAAGAKVILEVGRPY